MRPGFWMVLPLSIGLLAGTPLVCAGLFTLLVTRVTVLPDANQLTVLQSVLSVPISTRVYSLNQVRRMRLGSGLNCTSLQALMTVGSSETLIGCTDRTGYDVVAQLINRFLDAHRSGPQH